MQVTFRVTGPCRLCHPLVSTNQTRVSALRSIWGGQKGSQNGGPSPWPATCILSGSRGVFICVAWRLDTYLKGGERGTRRRLSEVGVRRSSRTSMGMLGDKLGVRLGKCGQYELIQGWLANELARLVGEECEYE